MCRGAGDTDAVDGTRRVHGRSVDAEEALETPFGAAAGGRTARARCVGKRPSHAGGARRAGSRGRRRAATHRRRRAETRRGDAPSSSAATHDPGRHRRVRGSGADVRRRAAASPGRRPRGRGSAPRVGRGGRQGAAAQQPAGRCGSGAGSGRERRSGGSPVTCHGGRRSSGPPVVPRSCGWSGAGRGGAHDAGVGLHRHLPDGAHVLGDAHGDRRRRQACGAAARAVAWPGRGRARACAAGRAATGSTAADRTADTSDHHRGGCTFAGPEPTDTDAGGPDERPADGHGPPPPGGEPRGRRRERPDRRRARVPEHGSGPTHAHADGPAQPGARVVVGRRRSQRLRPEAVVRDLEGLGEGVGDVGAERRPAPARPANTPSNSQERRRSPLLPRTVMAPVDRVSLFWPPANPSPEDLSIQANRASASARPRVNTRCGHRMTPGNLLRVPVLAALDVLVGRRRHLQAGDLLEHADLDAVHLEQESAATGGSPPRAARSGELTDRLPRSLVQAGTARTIRTRSMCSRSSSSSIGQCR